jgi:membrane protease YdiL (CAAX protease family)
MSGPRPPNEPAPWTGLEILLALFFVYLFWPALASRAVISSGFAARLYGPGVADAYAPEAEQAAHEAEAADARRLLRIRLNLLASALAFPFQAVTVPVLFYAMGGVSLARLGLTRQRLGRNILAGLGACLLIAPLVFAINFLATYLFQRFDPSAVQDHALTMLARDRASGLEWTLIVFTAVVIAPVLEEIIFRGVLQPWFAGFPNGGAAAIVIALAMALTLRSNQIAEALQHQGAGLLTAIMPGLFVLVLAPFYQSVVRHPPWPDSPAIFGTAVLFASFHASVWPTPIALFVLGLALGQLAARTGSLIGPMVLHGTFNALTCVMLAAGWK